jgi:hypothetical protein
MSQRANYFKLGLFVIGAIVAGILVLVIIGTGRFLQKRITVETYFNESVQGLDIGSKMKYRGVDVGQVTRISFTYVKYELDRPMSDRKRYVLVEAQLQPKLIGGKAASDIGSPEATALEVERGCASSLRRRITGTSYLEVDYVEPRGTRCYLSTGCPTTSTYRAPPRRSGRSSTRRAKSWIDCASSTSRARSPISTA